MTPGLPFIATPLAGAFTLYLLKSLHKQRVGHAAGR